MAQRRRRERSQVSSEATQLGLAWYSREDWVRLREIAEGERHGRALIAW